MDLQSVWIQWRIVKHVGGCLFAVTLPTTGPFAGSAGGAGTAGAVTIDDQANIGVTGLDASANAVVDAKTSLELAEAIRELAVRHGPTAVRYCVRLVQSVRELLDETSGNMNG